VVGFCFAFMLIPQLVDSWHCQHVNGFTAALTSVGLFVCAFVLRSLRLWYAFVANIVTGTLWFVLWVLRFV